MLSRVVGLGVWPLLVALSCSTSDQSGSASAGAGPEGGENVGGESTAGTNSGAPPVAGKSAGGSGAVAGGGGEAAAPGGAASPPAVVVAGAGAETAGAGGTAGAGATVGGGGAAAGVGGSDDGGAPSCVSHVGVMPAGPLAPSAAECASGCSVPPFDGVTLPTGCGDASNAPPAAAIGMPDDVPPGGWIIVNGQATQQNGPPMTGGPCDVGWCPTFVPTELTIGMSTSSGPYYESAFMKAGVGEVAHLARTQTLISFDYRAIGPAGYVAGGVVDEEHYSDYFAAPGQPGGWVPWGDPGAAVLGVDTRPGQNRAYLAYAGVWSRGIPPVETLGPRFGLVSDESPVFEDLPEGWDALDDIEVDEHGDAIVLQKGVVYRHLASGWEEVAIPCGVTPSQLVIDGASAVWYLLGNDNTLYQRAANGSWTKTATPGGRLFVAGGTVHLMNQGVVHRVGTAWSQPLFPPIADSALSKQRVAIDSCWAPHFVSSWEYTDYLFELDYTRWTSRGFLSLRRVSNDFPDAKLAVTVGHVFVHGGGEIFVLPIR